MVEPRSITEEIWELENVGVLGPRQFRTSVVSGDHWYWPVLEWDKLPDHLRADAIMYNEVRWSGDLRW